MKLNKFLAVPIAIAMLTGVSTPSLSMEDGQTMSMPVAIEAALYKFNNTYFEQAQKDGKMIVIDVHKKGCATCAAQGVVLDEAKSLYPDALFMRVDFESDQDAVKKFKAVKQSLIVVFNGEEEKARVIGETDKEKLLSVIAKGA